MDVDRRKRVRHKMDHLVCFVPAMLALGSHMGAVTGSKAEQYMQLAENLTETCWQLYATQPTGRGAAHDSRPACYARRHGHTAANNIARHIVQGQAQIYMSARQMCES